MTLFSYIPFGVSGMSVFLKNISFHGILLDALFEKGNADWAEVSRLFCLGITEGAVQPLPTTVFEMNDVEAAFRIMAHGSHIGKVLLKVKINTLFFLKRCLLTYIRMSQ